MTAIRVLVGTKKGAFVLTSDAKRAKWEVGGPFFAGWEVYHMKGSPADPDRIYASQSSGWFGQIVRRSDDGGKTWFQPGFKPGETTTTPEGMPVTESNKFAYDTTETGKPLTTHQWYDGTQHPWEFKRVWHMEPSMTDANTVYAGVEDAALFKSTDGGSTWQELSGLRGHRTGTMWAPGAGGMAVHTIIEDQKNPQRIYIAISAAGAFRTDDGGKTWKPINSLCAPDCDASFTSGGAVYAETLGCHEERRCWRVLVRNQRQPAIRFRFRGRCSRARTQHSVRDSDQERLRTFSAGRKVARLPQPNRRKRMGGAYEGPSSKRLLRKHPS